MPICLVHGCKSHSTTHSMFNVPKDKILLEKWKQSLRLTTDLEPKSRICPKICSNHFSPEDILVDWVHIVNGEEVHFKRERPLLSKGAIPTLLRGGFNGSNATKSQPITYPASTSAASNDIGITYEKLLQCSKHIKLPSPLWGRHLSDSKLCFSRIATTNRTSDITMDCTVVFHNSLVPIIHLQGRQVNSQTTELTTLTTPVKHASDVHILLENISQLRLCGGVSDTEIKLSRQCHLVREKPKKKLAKWNIRCMACQKLREDSERRMLIPSGSKTKTQREKKKFRHKNKLKMKVPVLVTSQRISVASLRGMAQKMNKKDILAEIEDLPESQKAVVLSCFDAAQRKGPHGKRYLRAWIYECILMRIKSPTLYRHIRDRNIMPLPSNSTVRKYVSKLQSGFWLQDSLYQLMKEKSKSMSENLRHGTLSVSEKKSTNATSLDKRTTTLSGFIDSFKHSSQQETLIGDHSLVLTFQPFQGKWLQTVGCFISEGCPSHLIVSKMVLECILLVENSGFFVDVVSSNGAALNRDVWTRFSDDDEDSVSCEHPSDEKRRLWMISDWPHLLGCIRDVVIKQKTLDVPEGQVKLEHWIALVENDCDKQIKLCPKLTAGHIYPHDSAQMNVAMAYQFFGESVATAMELCRENGVDERLADCSATVAFIRWLNRLADVMNSVTPKTALRDDSEGKEVIEDFLEYIDCWEECRKDVNQPILSTCTDEGLKVSLRAMLEITEYATKELGYEYLMTARLNQDCLEAKEQAPS